MEFLEPLRELIVKTGIFIWPLLLCSVVGLAIFLKKYSDMRGKKVISRVFLERLYGFLNKGKCKRHWIFVVKTILQSPELPPLV